MFLRILFSSNGSLRGLPQARDSLFVTSVSSAVFRRPLVTNLLRDSASMSRHRGIRSPLFVLNCVQSPTFLPRAERISPISFWLLVLLIFRLPAARRSVSLEFAWRNATLRVDPTLLTARPREDSFLLRQWINQFPQCPHSQGLSH